MQKNTLKEAVRKYFNTGGPQMDFVSQMEAITNKGNIRQVYAGFQSYPTTEDNNTIEGGDKVPISKFRLTSGGGVFIGHIKTYFVF